MWPTDPPLVPCFHPDAPRTATNHVQMIAAGIAPDLVVCNNILRACAMEGAFGEAANLIDTMKASGLAPNVVSYNVLVNAFVKRKELDKAFEVRLVARLMRICSAAMKRRYSLLAVRMDHTARWNDFETASLAGGMFPCFCHELVNIVHTGYFFGVLQVFQEMRREGVPPDFIVYRTLADALRREGFVQDAAVLYEEMNRLGLIQANTSRGKYFQQDVTREAR